MGNGNRFSGDKAAAEFKWPFTFIYSQD
jgi:hypothetical protein